MVIDALREAGAAEIAIAVPEIEAPFERIVAAGADAIAVPLRALTTRQWEQLAEAVEAGKRLWAGALQADGPGGVPKASAVVESVRRPWQQLGLPLAALGTVRVTPSGGLEGQSPAAATEVLTRLTQVADGLNQLALG